MAFQHCVYLIKLYQLLPRDSLSLNQLYFVFQHDLISTVGQRWEKTTFNLVYAVTSPICVQDYREKIFGYIGPTQLWFWLLQNLTFIPWKVFPKSTKRHFIVMFSRLNTDTDYNWKDK